MHKNITRLLKGAGTSAPPPLSPLVMIAVSVKLGCERAALDAWWQAVSARNAGLVRRDRQTVCEVFK
jgi:hypothetical protein